MEVTNILEMKKKASAQLIELPGWQHGETIFVKLKRPSFLSLCSKGLIPNQLLGVAQEVYTGKQNNGKTKTDMNTVGKVMDIMISEALVEPTMDDLEAEGIELTDEQKTEIFNYTQRGVTELKLFRENQTSVEGDNSLRHPKLRHS